MLKVSWTGNGVAERTDRVDIEIPPGSSQVIMSLRICSGNALRVLRAAWGRG